MMGRLNALTCLCILVLAVVQPAVAGWTVDNLTGRAELSRPGNDGSILLTRGSELKGDKGTLALSQGSSLRLRYSDGSALSLSSGSVLKFIKGGLWLKLKSGRILLELGKELAGKLRLGFLSSVVRASGSGTFSLSVSKSGKQVLFVVAGAVSVARKGFSRVIQKGMKAAWVKGELKTRSFVSEKLKGWWANTMGVAAVLLPAEKKAEKESC